MDFVSVIIILAVAALIIWINYLIAEEFYTVVKAKGYFYERKYFWICFFLGMVGYLLVIALPDRSGVQKVAHDELPPL